jgi:putative oxygen-independent coproporphyrinogen III oxidase
VTSKPLSFYIHIPYCLSRCGYCDFNTYTPAELGQSDLARGEISSQYMSAAIKEIERAASSLESGPLVPTIFFGGGTPSLMDPADIRAAIKAISDRFQVTPDCEITMEVNPDTVDEANLTGFVAAGVNRFSFGVQSTSEAVLSVLERTHRKENVVRALDIAASLGVRDLSVDLIYGTPGESIAELEASLDFAIALPINHVSAYALIVEAGTRLARRVEKGEIAEPDDDEMAEKYRLIDAKLFDAGFTWYELSNWSREGGESRHNQVYWRGGEWWGIGPGAHSFVNGRRWWNIKSPIRYIAAINSGDEVAEKDEVLTETNRADERIMLMMRLRDGLRRSDLTTTQQAIIEGFIATGAVDGEEWKRGALQLTVQGRLIADRIVRDVVTS